MYGHTHMYELMHKYVFEAIYKHMCNMHDNTPKHRALSGEQCLKQEQMQKEPEEEYPEDLEPYPDC